MAITAGDIGVPLEFNVQEDVSDNEEVAIEARHQDSSLERRFVGALKGGSDRIILYTTLTAEDLPSGYHGDWDLQGYVLQPDNKTRRSITVATISVKEKLLS